MFGAAEEVTGSNYLLEGGFSGETTRLLVDCGFFQGSRISEEKNSEPFSYDPSSINALLVTHAHLDHIGRIPKLVKNGFKGKIFSTPPTRDFAKLMLIDSLGVLEKESKRNKRQEVIYNEKDVNMAMDLWETAHYGEFFPVGGFNAVLRDAGHILGSAMVEAEFPYDGGTETQKIVFSGDLGNSPEPLLKDTEKINDADFLVVESTYGDRSHGDAEEADIKLERIIEDIVRHKGVLMIPAFSLERTQRVLFQINNLVENGRIPKVPIFLDSPLSIQATRIYKNYSDYYNSKAKELMLADDDLFHFPGLRQVLATEESKKISDIPPPKIIIAGSGMCNGGRILHHLLNYLPGKENILLLVSYQAAGSLGRQLKDGAKTVNIMGKEATVRAKIEKIGGYSSHIDMDKLFEFVGNSSDTVKKVFVAHGELKSSLFFTQRLRDYMGVDAVVPKFGKSYKL